MQRNAIYVLLLSVAGLTVLGMVMLFSTSAFARESHGDIYFFVKRQSAWLVIALFAAAAAGWIDYSWWKRTWWAFFGVSFVLLILCFIPPIGMKINGAWRWINLGVLTFQPSELAKVSAIFFLAWWYDKFEGRERELFCGIVSPMACLAVLVLPITFEVDFGTTALIGGTALAIMFLAGIRLAWLAPMIIAGLAGMIYAATHVEERMGRLLAFLNPEKYPDEFYQQLQGLIAIGSGGISGLGLGEGRQKMLYLPYAHTDFIFPMIAEELGLYFTLLTVFGYLIICLYGTLVALNARDRFGMLLGFGCVMIISLQATVNIGVTTALLPNKGMPLPFISSGGSNLAICYFMIGILINIHRHGNPLIASDSPALRRVRNFCKL